MEPYIGIERGPERYFLDARLGEGPAESSHYGRHRSRRRRQGRPGTKAGGVFRSDERSLLLGVAEFADVRASLSPIGLLLSSILEFFEVPRP